MKTPEVLLKFKDIKRAMAKMPKTGPFGKEIVSNPQGSVKFIAVITSAKADLEAEIHEKYTDIFIIQQGKEKILVGGKLLGKRLVSPGEWKGKKIKGAKKYLLSVGDIVIIPKGTAHQHISGKAKRAVIKMA